MGKGTPRGGLDEETIRARHEPAVRGSEQVLSVRAELIAAAQWVEILRVHFVEKVAIKEIASVVKRFFVGSIG